VPEATRAAQTQPCAGIGTLRNAMVTSLRLVGARAYHRAGRRPPRESHALAEGVNVAPCSARDLALRTAPAGALP